MGHAGLGHALLRLNDGAELEQPFTLDGGLWIVADARIDARADLAAALQPHTTERLDQASDVELILRAYLAWGEQCVTRLLGDFTFAIWDAARRRLFCARDHLGVKPLFYAEVGRCVVVSNTLDCVRKHPLVSRALDDRAIGDFLLFGAHQEADATAFRDIRRLPPAHSIPGLPTRRGARGMGAAGRRAGRVARSADYTDRFLELLRDSVGDRPYSTHRRVDERRRRLDDACRRRGEPARERGVDVALRAITSIYERLIPTRAALREPRREAHRHPHLIRRA
jgi:asparagine synthase (glutamine-hydrolysing)